MKPLPQAIKELREARGFTQEELAAAINCQRGSISLWESGKFNPSLPHLQALVGEDLDPRYLIGTRAFDGPDAA